MNFKKAAFLIVLFVLIAVATGCSCNGGDDRNCSTKGKKVVIEPSMTGFWQTRVVEANAD